MGGMQALQTLLGALPQEFPLAVVVVQHRSPDSGEALRHALQRAARLRVREPADKESLEAGKVYVAPPDYHLLIDDGAFALSTDAPVCHARPSIDVLFESAADAIGDGTLAVVLTGASADGARGAARIKESGGYVIVQDPEEAERPEMPRAAIAAAQVDQILPLAAIGPQLIRLAGAVRARP